MQISNAKQLEYLCNDDKVQIDAATLKNSFQLLSKDVQMLSCRNTSPGYVAQKNSEKAYKRSSQQYDYISKKIGRNPNSHQKQRGQINHGAFMQWNDTAIKNNEAELQKQHG